MKAIVDPDLCIACGLCVETCPEVFEMPGDVAVTKVDQVPESVMETCREAADNCPTDAIAIQE